MIKKLAQSIREFKKDSILSAIFMCFEVTMEVVIPILMANLIDYGIDKGNMPFILKIGIALLISAAISLFFGIMSGQKAAIASAGFAKNLRKDMYYKVQDYSFSNIDKFSTDVYKRQIFYCINYISICNNINCSCYSYY